MLMSSTYTDGLTFGTSFSSISKRSNIISRSSAVAVPDPAVIQRVAWTSLEYTPSMHIVRGSWYVTSASRRIAMGYPRFLAASMRAE